MEGSTPPRPRALAPLGALLLGSLAALSLLELGLRLAPAAISPRLLILFEPGLRASIAAGRFPLESDTVELDRDDGGPPLRVARPLSPMVSIDVPDGGRATPLHDELGFCNAPRPGGGDAAVHVIALGDSFTGCHGVDVRESWPHLLGARTGVPSYNLGRGGTGLYEYVQLLKQFGLSKRPRVVIANVYGGNDLRDAVRFHEYRETLRRTGRPPSDEPESVSPALRDGPLGRHSYALNLLLAFATRAAHRAEWDHARSAVDFRYTIDFAEGPVAFNVENRDRDEVLYALELLAGRASLELWDPPLRELAALARQHGFSLVVSYTPAAHDAYGERVRFADPELAGLLARAGAAARAHLAELGARLGYTFHDLTPALREAAERSGPGSLLYDPRHLHFTPRGNAVVAASLARLLADPTLAAPAPKPRGG
jgi:hypothetical protein